MKQLFILLYALCSLTALAQYPVSSINITIPAKPAANTADWGTGSTPFVITAQARMVQGQVPGNVAESRILVTIKKGGSKICGSFTQQTAPNSMFNAATKTWSGAAAVSLLGNSCTLKPGSYELCVQFFSSFAPIIPLSNEVCKPFSIDDKKQAITIPPQNVMPVDGKQLSEQEAKQPIMFRWTKAQIIPPPADNNILYKVRVVEIKKGQSKTQALQNNTPLDIIEVKNLTQEIYRLTQSYNGLVWNVEAYSTERVQGREPMSYGKSEPTTITFKKSDEDAKLKELSYVYDPPVNQVPENGKVFGKEEAAQRIRFTWSPVTPTPKEPVLYKVRVMELREGQSKTEALKQNKAVAETEVKNATQTAFRIPKCNDCTGWVWNVEATGTERLQGEAPKNYGSSEPTSFMSGPSDCTVNIKIDSIKCTSKKDLTGNQIYQVFITINNTGPNPVLFNSPVNVATNPYAILETYFLKYLKSNGVQFPTPGTIPVTVATGISSFNTEVSLISTETELRLTLHLYDNISISSCNPSDTLLLPNCACNPCKGKQTVFGMATPTYTNNSISVVSTVTHGPTKVIKVSAQIVDFERLGEYGCLKCTKDSKEFGNYTGGSLNSNGGHILNGGIGYGKQIQWQFTVPTTVSGFAYDLQMMVPPLTEVSCCKDSIKYCTRWSFTDENCVTCDTLICTVVTREYKVPPIIWLPGAYAAQIAKMGEPFVSWYKQESKELPGNFNAQVEELLRRQPIDQKETKKEEFIENLKSVFYKIQGLRLTAASDGVWNVISANPVNSSDCGNGDFETGSLNTSEWSGAYGTIGYPNDPINGTYTAGFNPVVVGLNLPITVSTNQHSIVGYGNDPSIGAALKTTSSASNLYSFRLGNQINGGGSEILSKKFMVSGTGRYRFMYAVVLNDPNHGSASNPGFWVKVYSSTGPINNKVYLDPSTPFTPVDNIIVNSSAFFQTGPTPYYTAPARFKDWTCANIDLSQFIGQTVSVAFISNDCTAGGHFGYVYIDDWCGNCAGATNGVVNISPIADSCIKQGTQICVAYTLPKIGTATGTGTIKLQFYQNGVITSYSITSPTLTANGNYCFTIDPSQLPCTNGQQGYDVVATGNFTIGTTNLTPTSPDPVGTAGNVEGIKPGKNNDLVCCGTLADRCCDNFVKTVTATVTVPGTAMSGYTNIKFAPTFTAGPKLIKQIRISIVNVETSSTNKDCLTCESRTNFYGAMSVPQGISGGGKDAIEGMVYPTNPLIYTCVGCPPNWRSGRLSHEVIWGSNSGPGYNLMDGMGDQSTVFNVFVPKKSTLSCCDDTIKICVKYSFTDIDCKTCDTVICYRVINRQTINTYNPSAAVNLLKYLPFKPKQNNFGSLASLAILISPDKIRFNNNKRLFPR